MSQRLSQEQLPEIAVVSDAPARPRGNRNFGLPTGLHAATAPPTWGQFAIRGIDTPSGRLTANEAAIQVPCCPC